MEQMDKTYARLAHRSPYFDYFELLRNHRFAAKISSATGSGEKVGRFVMPLKCPRPARPRFSALVLA
jgi:hypothetical protein